MQIIMTQGQKDDQRAGVPLLWRKVEGVVYIQSLQKTEAMILKVVGISASPLKLKCRLPGLFIYLFSKLKWDVASHK